MKHICSEHGQTVLEVSLLIALLILLIVGSIPSLRQSVISVFIRTEGALSQELDEPFDSSPDSPRILWSDDLQNLNQWTILQGNWEATDGFIRNTSDREGRIMTNFSGEDFVVNIEVAHLLRGNGYGVWLRANNVSSDNHTQINGYTFQYDPGYLGGEFIIRKWENGQEQEPLARVSGEGYDWNDPHAIRVIVQGDTFTVFVDGEEKMTAQDSSYSSGYVGLRTWSDTRVEFSGFTVEALPEDI